MSRKCQVTGKKPQSGNHVSHAHNKRRRRWLPNLQTRRFWVPKLKKFIKLRLTTQAMRTIDKKGIETVLEEMEQAK